MKRIKKGDTVIVCVGKSKGHVGTVLKVSDDRVFVEGANLVKKHVKANSQRAEGQGGIISKEASIDVSNIALYNPQTKKADKVGFKFIEENGLKHKVRYFKSNNELIDPVN